MFATNNFTLARIIHELTSEPAEFSPPKARPLGDPFTQGSYLGKGTRELSLHGEIIYSEHLFNWYKDIDEHQKFLEILSLF